MTAKAVTSVAVREGEGRDQVFKGHVRILIKRPHGLGGIDRGAAAHCHDPVRFKFLHHFGAAHDGLNGRVCFHAFKQLHFHACAAQILFCLGKKAAALHGTAADNDHGAFPFQVLQLGKGALPMIKVTR